MKNLGDVKIESCHGNIEHFKFLLANLSSTQFFNPCRLLVLKSILFVYIIFYEEFIMSSSWKKKKLQKRRFFILYPYYLQIVSFSCTSKIGNR